MAIWTIAKVVREAGEVRGAVVRSGNEVWAGLASYLSSPWNVLDVLSIGAAAATLTIQLATAGDEEAVDFYGTTPHSAADTLLVLSLCRVLYNLSNVGPLLLMVHASGVCLPASPGALTAAVCR